jgi:RNA polymerase sigma-70 factor (ECF subfamily)
MTRGLSSVVNESAPSAAETLESARAVPDELLALLYRQVAALIGPRRELDDIVQAAAERALRALPRFEGRSALSTWTYSIAYRAVVDHDRWFRRWRRRFVLAEDEPVPERCSSWDGEAAMMELRRARRLHQVLSELPATKRAVIVLHDLEGMALREVAEVVGANERTVRSRLRDARKKLAQLLTEDPLFRTEVTR